MTLPRTLNQVDGRKDEGRRDDVGLCLGPNTGDWWWLDTNHLHVSDVQVLSNNNGGPGGGVYWMFYSGGSFEGSAPGERSASLPAEVSAGASVGEDGGLEGMKMRPGLAMSQDGVNWARIEGEHHTGALFDAGQQGEWDELFIGSPQVRPALALQPPGRAVADRAPEPRL